MAREIVDHRDRIVLAAAGGDGQAVVKDSGIPVELVLARLATSLDVDDILRDYPELTRDDVRAVLSYARDRVLMDGEPRQPPDIVSPQQFYAAITKRPDVSELLRRLAR